MAKFCAEELTSADVTYVARKKIVAHGMVCLSQSPRGLNFRDVISAQRYFGPKLHLIVGLFYLLTSKAPLLGLENLYIIFRTKTDIAKRETLFCGIF